jgi:hypothetical protein
MQHAVRFEESKRVGECYTGMEPPPFARVPHPVDIKPVWSHAVDTVERRVELLAAIVLPSRPVALHEAISLSGPSVPMSTTWFHSVGRISGRKRGFRRSRMNASQAAIIARFSTASTAAGPLVRGVPIHRFSCAISLIHSSFADFILHAGCG